MKPRLRGLGGGAALAALLLFGCSDSGGSDTPAPECRAAEDCDVPVTCRVAACIEGRCELELAPDGAACELADRCVENLRCEAGRCAGDSKVCPPAEGPCAEASCDRDTGECGTVQLDDGALCDDGDPCTEADNCRGGTCAGVARDCAVEVPCRIGRCDPEAGGCVVEAVPDGVTCSDGDGCTVEDACANGSCVGRELRCDDIETGPCERASCDASQGACVVRPRAEASSCDDANACTGSDICVADPDGEALRCRGFDLNCPPLDEEAPACTALACSPLSGCDAWPVADGTPCDEGVCIYGACASCSGDSSEPDDTLAEARVHRPGGAVLGSLCGRDGRGDIDLVALELTAGRAPLVTTRLCDPGVQLRLLDSTGAAIAEGRAQAASLGACPAMDPLDDARLRDLPAGRYYVEIADPQSWRRPGDYLVEIATPRVRVGTAGDAPAPADRLRFEDMLSADPARHSYAMPVDRDVFMDLRLTGAEGRCDWNGAVELRALADGALIASADDAHGDPCPNLSLLLVPGEYRVDVLPGFGEDPGPYRLDIALREIPPQAEREPNDESPDPQVLRPGGTTRALILPGSDVDRFALEVPETITMSLIVQSFGLPCDGALQAQLFDADEQLVAEETGWGPAGCPYLVPGRSPALRALPAGRYEIVLRSTSPDGVFAQGRNYRLEVLTGDYAAEPDDDPELLTPRTVFGFVAFGEIADTDDVDHFVSALSLPAALQVSVDDGTTRCVDGPLELSLLRREVEGWQPVIEGGDGPCQLINFERHAAAQRLTPGTYALRVRATAAIDAPLGYRLTAFSLPGISIESEPNDSFEEAQLLRSNLHGSLSDDADRDLLRVELAEDSGLLVQLVSSEGVCVDGASARLLDADGNLRAEGSGRCGGLDPFEDSSVSWLPAGEWFIDIDAPLGSAWRVERQLLSPRELVQSSAPVAGFELPLRARLRLAREDAVELRLAVPGGRGLAMALSTIVRCPSDLRLELFAPAESQPLVRADGAPGTCPQLDAWEDAALAELASGVYTLRISREATAELGAASEVDLELDVGLR